ncbi:hypothetical protein Mgrana_00962 [Meiothermus granaticius NBRC 107808]|uniref:Uncharacterized protein n=1 Tax=Meiothermus granaticius NBRC 107808 TaxID=1227551 RepID=A0A399F939_9DEIN|nr:hypothetical protein Mgrana_00962 [Meiothermus granaticius NBRC 107808]
MYELPTTNRYRGMVGALRFNGARPQPLPAPWFPGVDSLRDGRLPVHPGVDSLRDTLMRVHPRVDSLSGRTWSVHPRVQGPSQHDQGSSPVAGHLAPARAAMHPLSERFLLLAQADGTGLRGLDFLGGHLHQPRTSLCRFVRQLLQNTPHPHVEYRSVETCLSAPAPSRHVLDPQGLGGDEPVVAHP